jgi:hypothetical protein
MKVPEPRVVLIDGAVGSRLISGSGRTDSTVAVLCWRRQGCLPTAPDHNRMHASDTSAPRTGSSSSRDISATRGRCVRSIACSDRNNIRISA